MCLKQTLKCQELDRNIRLRSQAGTYTTTYSHTFMFPNVPKHPQNAITKLNSIVTPKTHQQAPFFNSLSCAVCAGGPELPSISCCACRCAHRCSAGCSAQQSASPAPSPSSARRPCPRCSRSAAAGVRRRAYVHPSLSCSGLHSMPRQLCTAKFKQILYGHFLEKPGTNFLYQVSTNTKLVPENYRNFFFA